MRRETVGLGRDDTEPWDRGGKRQPDAADWLAWAIIVLGLALAANSVLGPAVTGTIRYSFSDSLRSQTIGLEAVSLVLVAPLCVAAGMLLRRRHPAGYVLGLGPAAYSAYMFVQYLVGPSYLRYPRVLPFHLAVFVLSVVTGLGLWARVDDSALPATSPVVGRRRSKVVWGLTAFIVLRYLPALIGSWANQPIDGQFTHEPAMFWSILMLDLGLVVPAGVAVALGLGRDADRPSVRKGLYALVGWYALVPPSVTAMAVVMLANDDPAASAAQVAVFVVATVAFWAFAIHVFRPLFAHHRARTR